MGVARVLILLSSLFLFLTNATTIIFNNSNIVQFEPLYTTIGVHLDVETTFNVTFVQKDNVKCNGFSDIDPEKIRGHLLVYTDDIWGNHLFRPCMNYLMDRYANAGYFSRMADRAGAAGVLVRRFSAESEHSGYRVAGFTKNINIPVLVTSKEDIDFLTNNKDIIIALDVSAIPNNDKDFIKQLRDSFRALNILNCILWPILTVLTAYFAVTDFIIYKRMDKRGRSLHPTLTKAAPFVSALFASIWQITDPFSYKLMQHFPTTFFERFHFGFLFVTACMLLKTWILAIGGKLKSPKVFKVTLILMNLYTSLVALITIIWVFVGDAFQPVGIAFGGITAVVCGVGFIYYGKDIVIILTKGNQNKMSNTYKNLSTKIIVFTVVFVVFIYACMFIYLLAVVGSVLSEFVMQFLLALAFIIIYCVLFFRKDRHVTPTSSGASPNNSNISKTASKNSLNRTTSDVSSEAVSDVVVVASV